MDLIILIGFYAVGLMVCKLMVGKSFRTLMVFMVSMGSQDFMILLVSVVLIV